MGMIEAGNVLGVGAYGSNGHQVLKEIGGIQGAELAACCGIAEAQAGPGMRIYASYEGMLADPRVQLVSICSPVRSLQGGDIIKALQAGKHVYAEKPCVMTAHELDEILALAAETGLEFFEMAGTAFDEPYATAGEIVRRGDLGQVVQVSVQKSYPYADWRPQDEALDGGLILQCGIHAVRMIEHVAGCLVSEVAAVDTGLGNPKGGGLRMAASALLRLENGGVASMALNYLNQAGHGVWGNEFVRIFGTRAFLETDLKTRSVRVVDARGETTLPGRERASYLQMVVNYLRGMAPRPFEPGLEVHPTRVVIAARESAVRGGVFVPVK